MSVDSRTRRKGIATGHAERGVSWTIRSSIRLQWLNLAPLPLVGFLTLEDHLDPAQIKSSLKEAADGTDSVNVVIAPPGSLEADP
jgi:hypothetical protein